MSLAASMRQEFQATLEHPARLLRLLEPAQAARVLRRLRLSASVGDRWTPNGNLETRGYKDYSDYVRHQQSKLDLVDQQLEQYDTDFRNALRQRLQAVPVDWTRQSVLCLAARQGAEVKAFIDLGSFAVGIDLNPGKGNRYVLHGDFHNLQFASQSVDVAFTNSFDHALYPERLLAETKRVLRESGLLLMEVSAGRNRGYEPGPYESCFWDSTDDVLQVCSRLGYELEQRGSFCYPGRGEQFVFRSR